MRISLSRKIPGPQYNVTEWVRKQLGKQKPIKPFERIHQAKVFLSAKLSGAPTKEAKRLSSLTGTSTQIMNSHLVKALIADICDREPELQDEGIVHRLKEMWNHKKPVYHEGRLVDKMDDTDLWKYSMDTVLKIKGHLKDSKDVSNLGEATGGITFNILQIPQDKNENAS